MTQDNSENEYKSGEELLATWNLTTREDKLCQAIKALMFALEELHVEHEKQSLAENLNNQDIFCSCADAYRMGQAALEAK